MRKALGIAFGLLVAAGGPAMAQNAPGMTTMWLNIDMDKARCLAKAADAVLEAGFGRNHETVGNTVFGERGRYTSAARCVAERNMIFIAVAGPDSNDTSRYATEIQNAFKK